MSGDKKIIPLRAKLKPQYRTSKQLHCTHPDIVVNAERRLLQCQRCDLWIEPFEYLLGWAGREWAAEYWLNELDEKLRKKAKQLKALKREERNIKARIRRAKGA